MDNFRTDELYFYIRDMIGRSRFNANGIPHKFFIEDSENSHSLFFCVRKLCSDAENRLLAPDNRVAYRILTEALSTYLLKYPASASAKQRLYQHVFAWCEDMGDQFRIPNYEMYLSDIPQPIERDLTISLIKDLHAREGITKDELVEKYEVSEKTIQVSLRQLSGESKYQPLRLGGQTVSVPVAHKEEKRRTDKRKFYTPNTLSPVVLQLNIMQVEALLKSLQLNYSDDHNIPFDLAVDVWGQLSDYAKERIGEIFSSKDPDLSEFLEDVNREAQSNEYRFMTESEMLMDLDLRVSEQIDIAYKGMMVCNLSLVSPRRTLKNQRVFFDHKAKAYYAVPANDLSAERLYFSLDEVHMVCEV